MCFIGKNDKVDKIICDIIEQNKHINSKIERIIEQNEEEKRRLDAIYKAMSKNREIIKGEQDILKIISDAVPYISVDIVESSKNCNYQFIFSSNDPYMAKHMWGFNKGVHSEKEIKTFFELSEKYYKIKPEKGTFFDIGGNIGTTSIYVSKNYPELNVVAFEPNKENCKMFKINSILNDCKIELNCMALGDKKQNTLLALSENNKGDHRLFNKKIENRKTEKITMDSFDSWFKQNPKEIKYVWIDVQGYEGFVLEGMINSLEAQIFPIWMEFCPDMLKDSGGFEKLMEIISKYFTFYIDRHDLRKKHEVKELYNLSEELKGENATDIFLIRRM